MNQPGFEPGYPGPKVAMLTIELHSIDAFQVINNNDDFQEGLSFIKRFERQ